MDRFVPILSSKKSMGYRLKKEEMSRLIQAWSQQYRIYAPKCYEGEGAFSDTDCVRYGEISQWDEVVWDQKSQFSYKEILLPLSETLFYFTENEVKEADPYREKGAILFLRSCDLHSVKRLDEIYLHNGAEDYYYKRLREQVKFVWMGCEETFANCFCVSMGTNQSADYAVSVWRKGEEVYLDCQDEALEASVKTIPHTLQQEKPIFVTQNETQLKIPEDLSFSVRKASFWDEYDSRCIACGRCNFVCPTCTCFTMQDVFYTENGKVGERRRVWASCMVDGYTDMAGGASYRKKNGERMRFKVLHKVYDYPKRNGYSMCVGCGRCEDVCPEYISFANCIHKLEEGMQEVKADEN